MRVLTARALLLCVCSFALRLGSISEAKLVRVAVIGDFGDKTDGVHSDGLIGVSDLVNGWDNGTLGIPAMPGETREPVYNRKGPPTHLDAVVTAGDNMYETDRKKMLRAHDELVGHYYHRFMIFPTTAESTHDSAEENRFYPCLGNKEWADDPKNENIEAYSAFFWAIQQDQYMKESRTKEHLPTKYYYNKNFDNIVEFFILDSNENQDRHKLFSTSKTGKQAMWLQEALNVSNAAWKIVITHFPPYSSYTDEGRSRWPYAQWGAHAVIAGHHHVYERFHGNAQMKSTGKLCTNFPYITNGVGGALKLTNKTMKKPGSEFRKKNTFGAQLLQATRNTLRMDFRGTNNLRFDCLDMVKDARDPCGFRVDTNCADTAPVSRRSPPPRRPPPSRRSPPPARRQSPPPARRQSPPTSRATARGAQAAAIPMGVQLRPLAPSWPAEPSKLNPPEVYKDGQGMGQPPSTPPLSSLPPPPLYPPQLPQPQPPAYPPQLPHQPVAH